MNKLTIRVVCRGGCNKPETVQGRQPQDPPEAETLVYERCDDDGATFHYLDEQSRIIARKT